MSATIDLGALALFARVAEHKSFTRAAREAGLPTSTVSRAIARLEDQLGARLIHRTTRKLTLTAEGASLFDGSQEPLRALATAASAVGESHGAPRGTLRITAPTDLARGFVSDVVSGFVARYPAARVDVTLTNRTVDLVAEGFDAALRAGVLPDSSLVAVKIGDSPARLFASPAYLARRGTPASIADLARHDGVMFRGSRGVLRWRLRGPTGEVVEASPIPRVIGDDFSFLFGAMCEGAGVGLLPVLYARDEMLDGTLVPLFPDHAMRGSAVHIVYPTSRHVPAKVTAFRDHAIERLRVLAKRPLPWRNDPPP